MHYPCAATVNKVHFSQRSDGDFFFFFFFFFFFCRNGCHFHPCFTHKTESRVVLKLRQTVQTTSKLILLAVYRRVLRQTRPSCSAIRPFWRRRTPLRPVFGSREVSPTGRARESPPLQGKRGSSFECTVGHRERSGVPMLGYRVRGRETQRERAEGGNLV